MQQYFLCECFTLSHAMPFSDLPQGPGGDIPFKDEWVRTSLHLQTYHFQCEDRVYTSESDVQLYLAYMSEYTSTGTCRWCEV